ncbi:Hint domain-containing protein [Paracoccus homiensis]|uniref:Hint domain-containing protein n=1 Tax=Paracoccus homiensis TaxID=364199 RepID=UPI00398D2A02
MPLRWEALYLGNISTDIDSIEGNSVGGVFVSENASSPSVLGTYGAGGDRGGLTTPIYENQHSVTTVNRFGSTATLSANNNGNLFEFFQTDRNGDGTAENYNFDGLFRYQVTLTYFDGTTADTTVLIAQMDNGDMWLVPPFSAGLPDPTLTAKAISNVTLNSAVTNQLFDLSRDRQVVAFACFAEGTMIQTPDGAVQVQDLAVGDTVQTHDNGAQAIRWIGRATVDLEQAPHMQPIRIAAGALGAGSPSADLIVSPQHRILVRSAIAQRMFGASEVLVAAKQLLELDGIELAEIGDSVSYVHFMCAEHQLVTANGALTESLFTGPEALSSVGPAARQEILELFPELAAVETAPVRPLVKGRHGRKLAARHQANGRDLLS